MADSFGRITDHLVDALEITPPALLPTVLPFWVPPPFYHAGEAAHVEFGLENKPKSGRLIISEGEALRL
jgi:hypothetical protein